MEKLPTELLFLILSNVENDKIKNNFSQVSQNCRNVFLIEGYRRVVIKNKENLKALSKAKNIIIKYTNVKDDDLKHLGKEKVHTIDLSWSDQLTDEGLKYIRKKGDIHTVNLEVCNFITDQGLKYIAESGVRVVNLCLCDKITDLGLECLREVTSHVTWKYCDNIPYKMNDRNIFY